MRARSTTPISWALGLGVVALLACSTDTTAPLEEEIDIPPVFGWGNGAPSGEHYNLNIIGVQHDKNPDMNGSSGGVIFVGLGSDEVAVTTTIKLCESGSGGECATLDPSEFRVLDKNGTDGKASFALPDPAPNYDPEIPDSDIPSVYSVYVRPLGKPGGHADNQTCGLVPELDAEGNPVLDPSGNPVLIEICSVVQMRLDRTKGKQWFVDATRCLLYIYADLNPADDDFTISRVPIFGEPLVDSWWEYTNKGLKLAQIRFYPEPGDVPAAVDVTECTSKGKGNGKRNG
jgi:hypothetical protein